MAQKYSIHPQTFACEREGLLENLHAWGNTGCIPEEDLEQLETILSLTRDLGVNLAGVEIVTNMYKIEAMQHEVNEFMDYVKRELSRGIGDWEQRLSTALVKSSRPTWWSSSTGAGAERRNRCPSEPADNPDVENIHRQPVMRKDPDSGSESDALQAYLRAIPGFAPGTSNKNAKLGRRIRSTTIRTPSSWSKATSVRRQLYQAMPRPRRVLPRPDSRRKPRPDGSGPALRSGPERQVHHLRGVVDPPGAHARCPRKRGPSRCRRRCRVRLRASRARSPN